MAEAARDTRTGELINDAYELHEVLEQGAVYDIYRATDRTSERTVRLKLLRPEFALQSNVVLGFLRASRSLAGLRHPNVSQVLALGSDETGIPFVVEEHVEGEPLARTIERFPDGMPLGAAIDLLLPVVEAVAAAHELGVAHGRIDREHVLLTKRGGISVPKVVRFDSGKAPRGAAAARSDRLAPELRDGRAVADARSDLWGLGALLYETLCGKPPPARGQPTRLDERAPHVPAELAAIVERCLSSAPAKRPERASAVRDVLCATRDRTRPAQAKPAAPADLRLEQSFGAAFAHAATLIAQPAPTSSRAEMLAFPSAERSAREADDTVVDQPDDEPVLALTADDGEDEQGREITLEAEPSRPPGRPRPSASAPPVEIKTMSDLAAAFGPIEDADRVGQANAATAGQTEEAADEPAARQTKDKRGNKDNDKYRSRSKAIATAKGTAIAPPRSAGAMPPEDGDKPATLPSRKALVEKNTPPARASSEEHIRQLRERTQPAERQRGRYVSAILFFLFAFGLLFAVPLLVDPTRTKAQQLLGAHAQPAIGAFAVLSVFALIRTWALQIKARPVLLRPVTISLQIVTALVCMLAATFFLPKGAFGPAEAAARGLLPWGSALFYLFLTLFGLMRGLREASSNALLGIAIMALYCGALLGSYRVLATTVLAKQDKGASGVAGAKDRGGKADVTALADYVGGDLKTDAGAGDKISNRNTVGASEADDMRGIEEMEQSRKRKSGQFDKFGKQFDELMH